MRKFGLLYPFVVLTLGSPAAVRANLVNDPSFDNYPAPPTWTITDTNGYTKIDNDPSGGAPYFPPHSGTQAAYFGELQSSPGSVSQTITTVIGQSYVFSFFISSANPGNSPSSELMAAFGDQIVLDQVNAPVSNWVQQTFDVTADATSTVLSFSGYDEPAWIGIDDVSVTAASTIPEPASITLLCGAIAVVCFRHRRHFAA